ncbi:guanylate cyclase 32E-like [Pomacea canaliculata]|uniref:guanylate cyclase 32E-like n=1 Tax=Pomacea canaliculata TaxID=400727 RepID=UPI000D734358|nr:guanylate cyclase 32E-like [Pomacea canaliculata]
MERLWRAVCWQMLLLWSLSIIGYEAQTQKENLTIGYITSMDGPPLVQAEGRSISGAMSLAVNVINENPSILPNHTLRFIFSDNHADPLASVHVLTEQWRAQAIAFIGPEGYCETEARVAASWNLPMVSYKCSDPVVSDKSRFPTFARTQPSSSLSGSSVVRLMLYYGWRKFSIVVELNDLMIEQDRSSRSWPNIYVLFTCTKAFQDMVNFLQEMGLTDTGEYVVIGIRDDETYDETKASSLVIPDTEFRELNTNNTIRAFRSVLMLISTPRTNPNFSVWEDNVRHLLHKPPFNCRSPRYRMQVYARALHEVLISGGDIRNGTDIFNRIKDRTFQGIQGHEVYIDENGDAEANFTVLALRPDTGIYGYAMRPIGRFLRDTLDRHNLTFIEDVKVYGEFIPLDEPECGMKGRNVNPNPM